MLFTPEHDGTMSSLARKLRLAEVPTSDLVAQVVASAGHPIASLSKLGLHASQLDRLMKAEAWTDLALALIDIELPGWKVRRLVCDEGTWFCSLSKQPSMPAELDDTADASHESLPLAILSAVVEARFRNVAQSMEMPLLLCTRGAEAQPVCCDSFA